jgi:hypothetical protein
VSGCGWVGELFAAGFEGVAAGAFATGMAPAPVAVPGFIADLESGPLGAAGFEPVDATAGLDDGLV